MLVKRRYQFNRSAIEEEGAHSRGWMCARLNGDAETLYVPDCATQLTEPYAATFSRVLERLIWE